MLAEPEALASRDVFDPLKYVALSDTAWASFGGQLRARFETWESYDFGSVSDPDEDLLLLRGRLHADLHLGTQARVFVELHGAESLDRRAFDDTRRRDVDTLDLLNGFAELRGERLRLRLGRQELSFGRQRLVSPLDWANARRTFDGATLEWLGEHWHTTAFATQPVAIRADELDDHVPLEAFYGVHATRSASEAAPRLDVYAYGIEGEDHDSRFVTVGGRGAGDLADSGFDYDVEAAGQAGESGFLAAMVATQLGYWLAHHPLSPRFYAGFDWASGHEDEGRFDQLFPLGHAYFGAIDVQGRSNLLAASAGVSFRPLAAVSAELVVYEFWVDDPRLGLVAADGRVLRRGSAGSAQHAGAEVDLLGRWQIDPHTALLAGYAHYFPGSFLAENGPDGAIDFAYLALQYTF